MIGYLDLPSGISGDMFLGCLLDGGWTIDQLRATIKKLHLPEEAKVESREVMKGPLRATRAIVHAPGGEDPPAQGFQPVHTHGSKKGHRYPSR